MWITRMERKKTLRAMLTFLRNNILFFSLFMLIARAGDAIIVPKNTFFLALKALLYTVIAIYTTGFILKFLPKETIWVINIMNIVLYLFLLGFLPTALSLSR
jgi:hypothetical protein